MEIGNQGLAAPRASDRQTQTDDSQMGRDAFMKLLVTQLQNQDPMDPMDTKQMVTQLSDLTSVEQLVAIEGRMQALEVGVAGMSNAQVSSLVGKNVTADTSTLRIGDDGEAKGAFRLDGSASEVTVTIRGADGEVVRELELGEMLGGEHVYEWDGTNEQGERMPAGRYTVDVAATDEDGTPVSVRREVEGVVQGVSYEDGYPELLVGEARLLLGDVRSIGM